MTFPAPLEIADQVEHVTDRPNGHRCNNGEDLHVGRGAALRAGRPAAARQQGQ